MKIFITTLAALVAFNVAADDLEKPPGETPKAAETQAAEPEADQREVLEQKAEQVARQVEQVARQVEKQAERLGREFEKHAERWGREIEKRAERFAKSFEFAQAGAQPPEPPDPADLAEAAESFGLNIAGGALNMANDVVVNLFGTPGRGFTQPLVIRGVDSNPNTVANLQEDLTVMSRLLNKKVEGKVEGPAARRRQDMASGIALTSMGGLRLPQSIYLDGYGALFLLNVRFPLVAPPAKVEREKVEPPPDTDWERTKRELYGSREGKRKARFNADAHQPEMEFDKDQVENLTTELLEAMKNAANIRNVKSDEFIALAVTGGGSGARGDRFAWVGGPPLPIGGQEVAMDEQMQKRYGVKSKVIAAPERGLQAESMLTIRVKKSDVDAFAKDKLSLEEFRKKAAIQTY